MQAIGTARLAGLLTLAAAAAGCATPAPPPVKEAYVELVREEADAEAPPPEAFRLVPYPLPPAQEATAYAALRSFASGRREGLEKLARLLGQPRAAPADAAGSPPVDLSSFEGREPPMLLFFPAQAEVRQEGACYLGHAAWVREPLFEAREVIHHLRLLVVNRLPRDLRLPVELVGCQAVRAQPVDLTFLVAADERGRRVDELRVGRGEERVLHAFFASPRLDPVLRVSWEVQASPLPDEADPAPGPWLFTTDLRRCYQLDDPVLTDLEDRVTRGEPLPEYHERPPPWREPRMQPVPPAPAPPGGGE